MSRDLKQLYRTMAGDPFPERMELAFVWDDRRSTLIYEKVTWVVDGERRGLRYGENPGQPAALYKLVNGNLVLGEVETIAPGRYPRVRRGAASVGQAPGQD